MFLQETDLNVVPGGIIPVMHVSQYDVGRELKFVLYSGYDYASLESGTTVTIEGTKPDGHGFQYSGVLDQNAHTATFVTTEQMTVLAGAIECKLTLYLNSQRIGTALFILDVEKAGINDNTIISDTELPLIIAQATEQMERAEAAADAAALSETNAATSETNAAASETNAATSETNAAASETNAANSEIICGSFMRMAGVSAASAEQSAIISGSFMRTAGNYADEAEASAASANVDALKSEGHALGTQNGTPVSSDSPYYHNNAKYWADEARQSSAGGVAASVIATAEPTNISSHAYAIGDQFVYNGILYTATSAISVGATITPGTNCSISDTITEQIGNAGHTILDEDGVTYPQRSKLQFEGCEVTDDAVNGITVVKCEGGGGSKISISTNETSLYGKTVTITGTSETKTATIGNDGKAVIDGFMDTGTVTISASDGTETASVTISIPYFGNYGATLSFWAATLSISTDSPDLYGQTITVKDSNNQTVATSVFSGQGTATATVNSTGTYTVSATGDGVTVNESVTVSAQTTYNVSLHLWTATVSIGTSSSDLYGATITVKKGGATVGTTTFSAQGAATYKAHETGTYTFECVYSGQTYSDSVTVSAETSYTAEINTNITITVTLYSAAADTVSFTDLTGAKTAVTDNDGKAENVSITVESSNPSITFTSSVAKDPNNLSNDYSKSVTVSDGTAEIKVMPDGAVYWYGYFGLGGGNGFGSVWSSDYGGGFVIADGNFYTNYFAHITNSIATGKATGFGTKNKVNVTNYSALKVNIKNLANVNNVDLSIFQINTNNKAVSSFNSPGTPQPMQMGGHAVGINSWDISSYSGDYGIAVYGYHSMTFEVYAIWLE